MKTANIGKDVGVIDANDKDAPMGPGKVCSNISIRGIVYVSIYRLYCSKHEC